MPRCPYQYSVAQGGYWSGGTYYPKATVADSAFIEGYWRKGGVIVLVSMDGTTPTDTAGNTWEEVISYNNLRIWKARVSTALQVAVDTIEVVGSYGFYAYFFADADLDFLVGTDTWTGSLTVTGPSAPPDDDSVSDVITTDCYYNTRIYSAYSVFATPHPYPIGGFSPDGDGGESSFTEEGSVLNAYAMEYSTATQEPWGNRFLSTGFVDSGQVGNVDFTANLRNVLGATYNLTSYYCVIYLRGIWGRMLSACYTPTGKVVLHRNMNSNTVDPPYTAYCYDSSNSLVGSQATATASDDEPYVLRLRSGLLIANGEVSRDGGVTWARRRDALFPAVPLDPVASILGSSVSADYDPTSGLAYWGYTEGFYRDGVRNFGEAATSISGFVFMQATRIGFKLSGSSTGFQNVMKNAPQTVGYCFEVARRPSGRVDFIYTEGHTGTSLVKLGRISKIVIAGDVANAGEFTAVGTIASGYQMATSAFDSSRNLLVVALWKVTENKWYIVTTNEDLTSVSSATLLCSNATRSAKLLRRPDGVFEFIYADTSEAIQFLKSRDVTRTSNGVWA